MPCLLTSTRGETELKPPGFPGRNTITTRRDLPQSPCDTSRTAESQELLQTLPSAT